MERFNYEGKICEECRFFKQHYAVYDSHFCKTDYGHCSSEINQKPKMKFLRRHNTACKYWESMQNLLRDRKEINREILNCLVSDLNEVVTILKEDLTFGLKSN